MCAGLCRAVCAGLCRAVCAGLRRAVCACLRRGLGCRVCGGGADAKLPEQCGQAGRARRDRNAVHAPKQHGKERNGHKTIELCSVFLQLEHLLLDFFPRLIQLCLDCSLAASQTARNFGDRLTLIIFQADDHTLAIGQGVQNLPDQACGFLCGFLLIELRIRQMIQLLILKLYLLQLPVTVHHVGRGKLYDICAFDPVECPVSRDGFDPRGEFFIIPQLIELPHRLKEALLQHLLRLFSFMQHRFQQPEDGLITRHVQIRDCALIALPRPFHLLCMKFLRFHLLRIKSCLFHVVSPFFLSAAVPPVCLVS